MPNRDPREMFQRAQKIREIAETLSDPELKRLVREKADEVERLAREMAKSGQDSM